MLTKINSAETAEEILLKLLDKIHSEGPCDTSDFELLAYVKERYYDVFLRYEKKLLYTIGLFYKTDNPESVLEKVYSLYSSVIEKSFGRRFTPIQADVYMRIKDKRYFSFSAPTSTGKSYLFQEIIKEYTEDMVIVVPSRALIAEYVQVTLDNVADDKSILVMPFIDNINIAKTKRRIFIITPERGVELFKYENEFKIGLFLLDEAQITETDYVRGMRFDAFVRRIDRAFPNAKKVFSHPFVNNPDAQIIKHRFDNRLSSSARYDQNHVGKIHLFFNDEKFYYFSPYSDEKSKNSCMPADDVVSNAIGQKRTILIYISKHRIYERNYIEDFKKYIDMCPILTDPGPLHLIEYLRNFLGATKQKGTDKYSFMLDMMRIGVVVHHGSMPLKARSVIEDFVRFGYARICFATSTLDQGINMPFDVVWIDNFRNMEELTLKNLIGRAGRTTKKKNEFDYGYVIVNERNRNTFSRRIKAVCELSSESFLDQNDSEIGVDFIDMVNAIKTNNFNDELHLTNNEVTRLEESDVFSDIKFILENLLIKNVPITGKKYYDLGKPLRGSIKDAFKNIFRKHLRRQDLTSSEKRVLSTAIPILLWRIQGKSFREIVSLRHSFLAERDKKKNIFSKINSGEISGKYGEQLLRELKIYSTAVANPLPDSQFHSRNLFPGDMSVLEFDYDTLIYDTYDYLDKVISFSLVDPLVAAFKIYYDKEKDDRALTMINYIKYGTNDSREIWLLRYGFDFEDIEWVKGYIESISEIGIQFKSSINELDEESMAVIERFV